MYNRDIIDKLSEVAAQERINLGKAIPLRSPLCVYLSPSDYCNLRCRFCPQSSLPMPRDILSLDLAKKIEHDLHRFPDKIAMVRLCGVGEPLINADIAGIAKIFRQSPCVQKVELLSNGTLLNEQFAEELTKWVGRIIISVEGLSGEDYLEWTGRRIDFDVFMEKIRHLYSVRKDCHLHIKLHSAALKNKADYERFFALFEPCCDTLGIENLSPVWPEWKNELFDEHLGKFRFLAESDANNVHRCCPQVFKAMQIHGNGDVVSCCIDFARRNIGGNLNENDLYEIWNGEKIKALQQKHLALLKGTFKPCSECSFNDYSDMDNIDDDVEDIKKRMGEYWSEKERADGRTQSNRKRAAGKATPGASVHL